MVLSYSGQVARLRRTEVVVPGKFDVFERTPHSALNSVVLPVLGLPIRMIRFSACRALGFTGSRTAAVDTDLPVGRVRHDEHASRDLARQSDPGGAHLHDAGITDLAQPHAAVVDQAER